MSGKFNIGSPFLYSLMPFFSSKNINNNIFAKHALMNLIDIQIKNRKLTEKGAYVEEIRNYYPPKEKGQESNSSSNVSTISDEEHRTYISNTDKKEKENLNELLKVEIKKISFYYNSIHSFFRIPSLASNYYCDLTNDIYEIRDTKYKKYIANRMEQNYKKMIEKKNTNEI